MLRHVLLLKPKSDSSAEHIEAARSALAALVGQIPGLLSFHWGQNLAPAERQHGYAYGFSMDFVDRASLAAYTPHPAHVEAAGLVRAAFEPPIVFDFEC